jgi:hypothetical protein
MEKRHQDVLAKRAQGTGGWLIDTSEFKVWIENQGLEGCRALLGFGDPGAGKTFTWYGSFRPSSYTMLTI